ncbi:MAG: c-type cytochrome [Limisphaerales bacterium]
MNKPEQRPKGLDKRMHRVVDLLMAFVCISIVVKGCRQPSESELLANEPAAVESISDTPSHVAPLPEVKSDSAPPQTFQLSKAKMEDGKKAYVKSCVACHQSKGEGIPSLFPPLAKSDYLMADKERSTRILIQGQTGEIVVNGQRYNGAMPPIPMKDEQIANVLTYIRNSWGNSGEPVTVEEVRKVRADISGRPSLADAR